jgi:hypothetical protein
MKICTLVAPVITTISLGSISALAELAWLDTKSEVKCALGDETAKAEFRFENRGNTTVKILDLRRSCGCTSVEVVGETPPAAGSGPGDAPPAKVQEKREFAPGEKGKIVVEVNLGKQTGEIARSVTVKTEEDSPGQTLTIKAKVPNPVDVVPTELTWVIGREIKPKTILITATEGMKIKPVAVKSRHPVIEAEYKVVEKDKSIELSVQPTELDGSLLSEVQLAIDVTSGKTTVRKEVSVPVKVDYDW